MKSTCTAISGIYALILKNPLFLIEGKFRISRNLEEILTELEDENSKKNPFLVILSEKKLLNQFTLKIDLGPEVDSNPEFLLKNCEFLLHKNHRFLADMLKLTFKFNSKVQSDEIVIELKIESKFEARSGKTEQKNIGKFKAYLNNNSATVERKFKELIG